MTQLEKLELYLDPEKTDWTEGEAKQLELLLDFAASKILAARYPFGTAQTEVPPQYENLQVRVAVELYSKMGAEGQTQHSENGISREWGSAYAAQALLREVTPLVGGFATDENA